MDESDLEIVEQGRKGMRALADVEEKLLEISRERRVQHEKEKKRNRTFRIVSIIFLFIFGIFAVIQWEVASNRKRIAKANHLCSQAQQKIKENPTIALRLAEEAWRLDKSLTITKTFFEIYQENNFYKIVAKQNNRVSSLAFSPDGNYILTGSEDGTARLWMVPQATLEYFLKKGNPEPLTPEQKKEYGIDD